MDKQGWLTERFKENHLRLRGVANRMLGSLCGGSHVTLRSPIPSHPLQRSDMITWVMRRAIDKVGRACSRVVVAGTPVMFDHGRVPALADVAVVRTA